MTTVANDYGISYIWSLNDKGQIVGQADKSYDSQALFYDGAKVVDLDPGRTETRFARALSLNNEGVIVGDVYIDSGQGAYWHPMYYRNGVMTELFYDDNPLKIDARFTCVNNFGHAAGHGTGLPGTIVGQYGIFYKDGELTYLGNLGYPFVYVAGINNSDQVVGDAHDASHDIHACIWQNGVMKDMGTPAGLLSSALAINDAGVAVGKMDSPYDDVTRVPFVYSEGRMIPVRERFGGKPDWFYGDCDVTGINNLGVVVGNLGSYGLPFIWRGGKMMPLNDLIDQDEMGGPLTGAQKINDSGQILASGSFGNGIITPLPTTSGKGYLRALSIRAPAGRGDQTCITGLRARRAASSEGR
ncbi:MAG: hypothetical protein WC378_15915, partial [Opitutaceae bacterium]